MYMNIIENYSLEKIENIYNSWKKCKDNHTYIENIHNTQLVLNNTICMNMTHYLYTNNIDINKRTIYIDTCSYIDIIVYQKFNHLILINCSHINLYITSGLISGLDILHCNNINIFIQNNKIDYTEISDSEDCNYKYNQQFNNIDNNIVLNDNIYINTNSCFNIGLTIDEQNIMTNRSYFAKKKYFIINKDNIKCFDNFGNETNF